MCSHFQFYNVCHFPFCLIPQKAESQQLRGGKKIPSDSREPKLKQHSSSGDSMTGNLEMCWRNKAGSHGN